MNKKYIIILSILFYSNFNDSFAQRGSSGGAFYFGYGIGKFSPGLGNIRSTTYLYNQQYGADFNYSGFLQGPALGLKYVKGFLDVEYEWIFRHGKTESTFTEPNTNEQWKLGIKTRYNTWFMGMGVHYKNFAVGAGVDVGRFKLFTKRSPVDIYNDTAWSRNTIYGSKFSLSRFLDITGGWIFYFDYMPKVVGLRLYYAVPMGSDKFTGASNGESYYFKPTNVGVTFLFHIGKIE